MGEFLLAAFAGTGRVRDKISDPFTYLSEISVVFNEKSCVVVEFGEAGVHGFCDRCALLQHVGELANLGFERGGVGADVGNVDHRFHATARARRSVVHGGKPCRAPGLMCRPVTCA